MVLGIKMEFDQNRDESRQSVKANKMYSPALCNRMYKRVGLSQKITSIPTMPLFLLLLLVMILILIPATTQMISTASAFSSSSIITTHGGGIFIPKRRRQRLNKASFLSSINDQQEEEATPIATETAREDHHHLATDDSNSSSNSNIYHDWLFTDRKQRVIFYGSLALLETMFWYYLAPGIDPQSRYFNPIDGELITNQLLNPSIVLSPPIGSGLGFSSLLLNSFLILPMVWSLLLLQEIINSSSSSSSNSNNNNNCATNNNNNNINIPKIITVFVCACGFFVGGGALIPYMMFRRPSSSSTPFITGRSQSIIHPDSNNNSSSLLVPLLQFFEKEEIIMIQKEEKEENEDDDDNDDDVGMKLLYPLLPPGQIFLVTLLSVIVFTFVFPFIYNTINNNDYDWSIEWDAFLSRIKNSQFTSLALFDFTMISIVIIDPIIDDAIRRGYINFGNDDGIYDKGTATTSTATDIKRFELVRKLLPFVVIPLIGPVMWICLRPPMQ